MTEQEIERCLERFTIGKATDVMNFDYSGTLAYLQRLKAENAELKAILSKMETVEKELRERLEKAVELPRVECIMTREWLSRELIGAIMFEWCVLYKKGSYLMAEPCLSKGDAEIRLAELKGEKE